MVAFAIVQVREVTSARIGNRRLALAVPLGRGKAVHECGILFTAAVLVADDVGLETIIRGCRDGAFRTENHIASGFGDPFSLDARATSERERKCARNEGRFDEERVSQLHGHVGTAT